MNCNYAAARLSHMNEVMRNKLQQVDWRLGRALALVAIGAAMHLPLPGEAVAPAPPGAPLIIDVTPRSRSRLNVERTTIFAPATAELERRGEPEKKTPVGHRSASLLDIRPPELRSAPVATSGIGGATGLSSAEIPRPLPSLGPDPAPEPLDRSEPALPRVGLASAPGPGTANAAVDNSARAEEPAASASVTMSTEEDRVRRLLDEYAGAYERLDVGAAQAVYPGVDEKALKKAFAQLASQRVRLQSCGITISGSTANAICRGTAIYQPRIGTRPVQIASREWMFDLSKNDTAWKIVHTFVR